jgi:hypothetical protein
VIPCRCIAARNALSTGWMKLALRKMTPGLLRPTWPARVPRAVPAVTRLGVVGYDSGDWYSAGTPSPPMIGTPWLVRNGVSFCSPETDSQPTIASTPWLISFCEH